MLRRAARTLLALVTGVASCVIVQHGAHAAITVAQVTQAATTTAGTTQTTASFTPAANTLYLIWTVQGIGTAPPTTPTVACANGLTMVQVNTVTFDTIAAPLSRVTLFRGMKASGLAAGTCTISWGQTTTGHGHVVQSFTGADTSGTDGSGAVMQSATGSTDNATAAAGLSIALGALQTGSATAGGFSNSVNSATSLTAGAGYTAGTGVAFNTPATSLRAEWRTAGATPVNMTQSAVSNIGGIAVEVLARPTVTIGNGTAPASVTIPPGGPTTDLDYFTLATDIRTDTVTAATVTLTPAGAFNNIGQVDLTDNSNNPLCPAVTNPASNTISFTGCSIPVTTSATTFKVRITPESHANMPPVPGASYATTGTVTAFVNSGLQAGTDTSSATVTVDNASPTGATAVSGSAGKGNTTLNWTTSNATDFDTTNGSVIYRWAAAAAGAEVPTEGVTPTLGSTNGAATVACLVSSARSTALSRIDGSSGSADCNPDALTGGQAYSYRAFQRDSSGNYDAGVNIGTFTQLAAPTVAKSFSVASIPVTTGTSTLTITITNPNSTAISGLAFTDTYPTNLVNAAAATKTCTGGTLTGANGASSVSLSGSSVAANNSCTVTVSVRSATAGSYVNSSGPVTSTNAPNGTADTATLTVYGAANKLAIYQQPSNTTVGTAMSPAITVQIQDATGNVVATDTRTVTLSMSACGGTLGGTTSVAAVAGVATFSNISSSTVGTACTLTASSSPVLTTDTSVAFNITALPASLLAFVQQPSNAAPNTAISPAITVEIRDSLNHLVTGSTANVTLAIGANPGLGSLAGTVTRQASGGVATFSGLSINNNGTGYTLTAASSGLTGATSSTFNISSATQIAFFQQPANTPASSTITPAVSVRILDAASNVVTTSSDAVTLTIGSNGGSPPGTLSVNGVPAASVIVNAVNGIATFNGLSIDQPGTYTLAASATPLGSPLTATSGSFNITALSCYPSATTTDNFADITNWSFGKQSGTFTPIATNNRLQLTDTSTSAATWATLSRVFPGAGNKVIAEFDHFAHDGTGADGIAIILSDSAIAPIAGAFGGSMGYAQKGYTPISDCTTVGGCPGFAGGWMGVALDEYGNFLTNAEGRVGGASATRIAQTVSIRGSGSGMSGYRYLKSTSALTPHVDADGTATPPHRYRVTVDHRDSVHAWVSVERDTSGGGANYTTLIGATNCADTVTAGCFDIKDPLNGQSNVPTNWIFSFTGASGAATNYHEISNLKICTVNPQVTPSLDHVRLEYSNTACTGSGSPTTVTVKACADAACTSLYPGAVTVNLSVNGGARWSNSSTSISVALSGGQGTATLTDATAESVSLSGTGPANVLCYSGGTEAACSQASQQIVFSACTFDAVEVGALALTPIYTKLSGTAFNLSVVSRSSVAQTVSAVEIVDANVGSGCSSYQLLSPSSTTGSCANPPNTVTPTALPTNYTTLNQAKTFCFNYANAVRNARIRITFATNQYSCSYDNFAVRPASFSLTSSANNATNGGTTIFKAGSAPFSVTATAVPGYDGSPRMNGTGILTTTLTNLGTLTSPGFPAATVTTGVSTASGFTYSEVGNFSFTPYAIVDDNFSQVDSGKTPDPECNSGYSNTIDSNGKYGCDFGNIAAAGAYGRFVPDHFELSAPSLINRSDVNAGAGCAPTASTFTYMGEPMRLSFTLTAKNAAGNTTLNYNDTTTYAKLTAAALSSAPTSNDWTLFSVPTTNTVGLWALGTGYSVSPGTCKVLFSNATPSVTSYACTGVANPASINRTASPRVTVANTGVSTWTNGVANFTADVTLQRADAPDGPYNTLNIGVAPQDSDGTTLLPSALTLDADNNGINERALVGLSQSWFGILRLDNATGSQLRDVQVPIRAMYLTSPPSGFSLNTQDNCTTIPDTAIALGDFTGTLNSTNMGIDAGTKCVCSGGTCTPTTCDHRPASTTLANGAGPVPPSGSMLLKQPSPAATGSFDMALNLGTGVAASTVCLASWANGPTTTTAPSLSYLLGNWCGANYDKAPIARINLGIARSVFIYLREKY